MLVGFKANDTYSATEALQSGKAFGLGDRMLDHDGRAYVYVQSSAAIAANDFAFFNTAYSATAITTATGTDIGSLGGVAQAAFAANEFGWLQTRGGSTVNVLANAAAAVRLNTTATAGKLDDDATAGARRIQGVYLTAANGAGTNATACILNDPFIEATI